jgi:hypothetical protein
MIDVVEALANTRAVLKELKESRSALKIIMKKVLIKPVSELENVLERQKS